MKIKFQDLCGRKGILCAVDDLKFRIGNLTFEAIEDESDGYRSSLSEVKWVEDNLRPTFREDVQITADDDYFYVTSLITEKVILSIGTDYTDSYYPCFRFGYNPSAISSYEDYDKLLNSID